MKRQLGISLAFLLAGVFITSPVSARLKDRNIASDAGIKASKISGGTFGSDATEDAAGTTAYTFPGAVTFNGAPSLGDGVADTLDINGSSVTINTTGLYIATTTAVAGTNILTLDGTNYRVGIGTRTPAATLDVNGLITARDTLTESKGINTATVTVTGAATFDGDATLGSAVTDTITINGYTVFATSATLDALLRLYNRTSAQISATTPTAVGQTLFDTTLNTPVYSTGTTTSFDWVLSTGGKPSGY